MSSTLTWRWEHTTDIAGATHRFTSTDEPPTLTHTKLIDDSIVISAASTVTVWDSATSPLPAFDWFYAQAQGAALVLEVTITVSASDQVQVFTLPANGVPFELSDDTAYFALDGTAGLVTKVRAAAPVTNTADAVLRYAVALA